MKEGLSPQKACEKAVSDLAERLKRTRGEAGDISVVAMNAKGDFGGSIQYRELLICRCHKYISTNGISCASAK